jgi:hypothetical protein
MATRALRRLAFGECCAFTIGFGLVKIQPRTVAPSPVRQSEWRTPSPPRGRGLWVREIPFASYEARWPVGGAGLQPWEVALLDASFLDLLKVVPDVPIQSVME